MSLNVSLNVSNYSCEAVLCLRLYHFVKMGLHDKPHEGDK